MTNRRDIWQKMFWTYMDRIATPLRHPRGSPPDHVWRVQRLRVSQANNSRPVRDTRVTRMWSTRRWWAGAVSVAGKNRLAATYGGGWLRGKERRSVAYGGSGNAGTQYRAGSQSQYRVLSVRLDDINATDDCVDAALFRFSSSAVSSGSRKWVVILSASSSRRSWTFKCRDFARFSSLTGIRSVRLAIHITTKKISICGF